MAFLILFPLSPSCVDDESSASRHLNPELSQISGKIQDVKTEMENLSVFKLSLDFTEQEKYLLLRE